MLTVQIQLEDSALTKIVKMQICPFPNLLMFLDGFSFEVLSVEYSCDEHIISCWVECADLIDFTELNRRIKQLGWNERS